MASSNSFVKAFKRLPKRNRNIATTTFVIFVGVIYLTFATIFSIWPFNPPPKDTTKVTNTLGGAKSQVANINTTTTRGETLNISQEYLETLDKKEEVRLSEAKAKNDSFVPSLRGQLKPATEEAAQPEKTLTQEVKAVDDNSCDTIEGKGTRLSDGRCFAPSGNIYEKDGRTINALRNQGAYDLSAGKATPETEQKPADPNDPYAKSPWTSGIYSSGPANEKERDALKKQIAGVIKDLKKEADERGKQDKSSAGSGDNKKDSTRNSRETEKVADSSKATAGDTSADKTQIHGPAPGDMIIGVIETAINSDSPSDIRIRVQDEILNDSLILATPTLSGERIIVKTTFLNDSGKFTTVDAVLVDPNTRITSLQGDVDNHYFTKFAASFAYGFMRGQGESERQTGTTTIAGDTSVVTRPDSTSERAVKLGLEESAKVFEDPLKQLIARPPTVTIPQNTLVGIMFVKPTNIPWLSDRDLKVLRDRRF